MSKESKKERLPDDFVKSQIEGKKKSMNISKKIIKDLTTKRKYKKFFAQYNPESVKSFINHYAFYKSNLYILGPWLKEKEQKEALKYKKEAREYLTLIQEEKLVRLQFEWNEENMVLEGMECNPDFYYYYENVFECPFLSPIIKDEIDDLASFLLSDEFYVAEFRSDMTYQFIFESTFHEFVDKYDREDDDQGEGLQKYHYYLMEKHNLPPLSVTSLKRAKKENVYINLELNERRKKNKEVEEDMKKNPRMDIDPRLPLYSHRKEDMQKFMREFEDPKMIQYYDVLYRFHQRGDDGETDIAIDYLQKTKEQVTVHANDNWRTAIKDAAEKHKREKIAIALYSVFEDYLKHIKKSKKPFLKVITQKDLI